MGLEKNKPYCEGAKPYMSWEGDMHGAWGPWCCATMDPHEDGHVMTGYEIFITWVCFASHPVRGMLQEQGWG
jgi:hypothetical protein